MLMLEVSTNVNLFYIKNRHQVEMLNVKEYNNIKV